MNRLNNLATELASLSELHPGEALSLETPREGWVYIACKAPGTGGIQVSLNDEPLPFQQVEDRLECMRYLPAGALSLVAAEVPVQDLTVRAIPELAYCKYGYNPYVPEYGPYDWAFLKKHVLNHINTIIGPGNEAAAEKQRDQIQDWKWKGGRWIGEHGAPGTTKEPLTDEEMYKAFTDNPGMQDPLFDGVMADEFFSGDNVNYPGWARAVRKITSDPAYDDKTLYPYCGSHYPDRDDWGEFDDFDDSNSSAHFYQAVFETGCRVSWERYLQERHCEEVAEEYLQDRFVRCMEIWQKRYPDCAKQMMIALGYMGTLFSLNAHPSVDGKVFMDMQFRLLATDPHFDGLYGLTGWTSGYADEETIRWTARLYRHYGIEGNTDLLSERLGYRYTPGFVKNPDFAHHWEGWTVPIENERNLSVHSSEGYSSLQGRWQYTSVGDTFLVLKRSAERANTVWQNLSGLEPGKLYSVKMISGDYGEYTAGLSTEKKHGVRLVIEGGDVIPEKTFQSVRPSHPVSKNGPFNRDNRFWFNYHNIVFRATSETGRLTITDWEGGTPAGPEGEELMVNFVEFLPYYEG